MNRHAIAFVPEPVRPVRYRPRRMFLRRLRAAVLGLLALSIVAGMALGAAALVARLEATQAQLDAAFLQGMTAGQRMCGRE